MSAPIDDPILNSMPFAELSTEPDRAYNVRRVKPSKVLPADRVSLPCQLEVLRAWVTSCSRTENVGTDNAKVASVVGIDPNTVSHLNPFFSDVGLLEKCGTRH